MVIMLSHGKVLLYYCITELADCVSQLVLKMYLQKIIGNSAISTIDLEYTK